MIRRAFAILLSVAPLLADAHPVQAPVARHAGSSASAAEVLHFAGDLTAHIAFESDAAARRRAARRSADTLSWLAGALPTTEGETSAVLLELASALTAYALPQIAAASQRRLALERRLSR